MVSVAWFLYVLTPQLLQNNFSIRRQSCSQKNEYLPQVLNVCDDDKFFLDAKRIHSLILSLSDDEKSADLYDRSRTSYEFLKKLHCSRKCSLEALETKKMRTGRQMCKTKN